MILQDKFALSEKEPLDFNIDLDGFFSSSDFGDRSRSEFRATSLPAHAAWSLLEFRAWLFEDCLMV